MIFTGKNVTQNPPEQMTPATPQQLYTMIASPSLALVNAIEALRRMRQIDEKAYKRQKTFLPYFIGSVFKDNIRNTANFQQIHYFVIDFDNLPPDRDIQTLKKEIFEDEIVRMLFTSPGGTGLKVLFGLESPVTNTKLFTDFYKSFALQFARKLRLENFADTVTCDVTRVCFLSADTGCLYREEAIPVQWKAYISELNPFESLHDPEVIEEKQEAPEGEPEKIQDEIYQKILHKLNPKAPKKDKKIFVPKALDTITEKIYEAVEHYEIKVKSVEDIQYGRRWTFESGLNTAEINIFYGKNGFSVVKTTKSGTDPDLCEAVYRIITNVLYT